MFVWFPYIFPVVEYPFVVRILGKGHLNAVDYAVDVGFHHSCYLDRHCERDVSVSVTWYLRGRRVNMLWCLKRCFQMIKREDKLFGQMANDQVLVHRPDTGK